MNELFNTLFLLICGHAVADYPLQGDFLARGKNHKAPLPGVPWWICLIAHALIHGGTVMLITENLWLGLAETGVHIVIDFLKCDGRFGFVTDQSLHVGCKVAWALI
jgi:hypothetical protein